MRDDPRIARMGELTERYFKAGFCCSEALIRAACEVFAPELPAELSRSGTGLCGGMGTKEATCGVYTGGAVALGLLGGNRVPKEDHGHTKRCTVLFQERLRAEAKHLGCKELLKEMGLANWNRRLCCRLTRRGGEILAEVILEKGEG